MPGEFCFRGATRRALILVLLFATVSRGAAASGTDASGGDAALRSSLQIALNHYLRARRRTDHLSAISLTVSWRRRADMNLRAGTTTFDGKVPLPVNSMWQIGSNTKAMTSAIVLQLEREGVLSIDDRLAKWLPQYPAWSRISIRQLLDMTSGIATYDEQSAFLRTYAAAPDTEFSLTRLVSYASGIRLEPGYNYTNTAYVLAQMIIEKATGDTYANELSKRLMEPLGLRDLVFRTNYYPASVAGRMPAGYFYQREPAEFAPLFGRDVRAMNLSWAQGAGGAVASTAALTKWVRALYEGRVLASKQQRELESLVSFKTGKPIARTTARDPQGFGLGVSQATSPRFGTIWQYEGGTFGYRVLHVYFPKSGTIITIALNSQPATDTVATLARTLYETLRAAGRG